MKTYYVKRNSFSSPIPHFGGPCSSIGSLLLMRVVSAVAVAPIVLAVETPFAVVVFVAQLVLVMRALPFGGQRCPRRKRDVGG